MLPRLTSWLLPGFNRNTEFVPALPCITPQERKRVRSRLRDVLGRVAATEEELKVLQEWREDGGAAQQRNREAAEEQALLQELMQKREQLLQMQVRTSCFQARMGAASTNPPLSLPKPEQLRT